MKEIKPIGNNLYWIESEPGDCTHYSYFAYNNYDTFCFMPKNSTFLYPQIIDYWDIKNIDLDNIDLLTIGAKRYNCNPWTLKECIKTMLEIGRLKNERTIS